MRDRIGRLSGKKEASELRKRVAQQQRHLRRLEREKTELEERTARQQRHLRRLRKRIENLKRQKGRLKAEVARQRRRIGKLKEAGRDPEGVKAENMVWIFGSGRTGSTWLARMMGENTKAGEEARSGERRDAFWNEPWAGHVFHAPIEEAETLGRKGRGFIFSPHYRKTWLASLRGLVLSGAGARFPNLGEEDILVIKEPGGSVGAPLLMEALPECRMVFLVRDPRDVVASQADAHGEGGFMLDAGKGADASSVERAEWEARMYLRNVDGTKRAYESHRGPKALVRYEDLRQEPAGILSRLHHDLGLPLPQEAIALAVEKHSWENVPEEKKGAGKFFRKASPGGWHEDLTPEQVATVEQITAPILEEFYP